MEKLNVAIADDNEKMVEVLGKLIDQDEELKLVGKAHNGEEICNIIREKQPDVVVLDIIMPKMDGLAVMEKFAQLLIFAQPCGKITFPDIKTIRKERILKH